MSFYKYVKEEHKLYMSEEYIIAAIRVRMLKAPIVDFEMPKIFTSLIKEVKPNDGLDALTNISLDEINIKNSVNKYLELKSEYNDIRDVILGLIEHFPDCNFSTLLRIIDMETQSLMGTIMGLILDEKVYTKDQDDKKILYIK